MPLQPLVIINAVGLTPALLSHAPSLAEWSHRPLEGVFPAVTATAQASMLTGAQPRDHGVVANGWYRRDVGEVRFWIQANAQMERDPLYVTARERATARGEPFTCANMFWWFAQGIDADIVATPKPHYGADGSKAFDILTEPSDLADRLEREHGTFPFPRFWGPMAGLSATRWIAEASATVIREHRPTLTLVYLPYLDYDLQRFGSNADIPRLVRELDEVIAGVVLAAKGIGAQVMIVSEYGIGDVSRPVYPNRLLRDAGLVSVRKGPFGEMLDPMGSRAFAVCDHQAAHVYVRPRDAEALTAARRVLEDAGMDAGIERVLDRDGQRELGIDHPRSGELVLVAAPDAWFAYPYWFDDREAPDFARTIDIHRKPGYDPCEMFFAPHLRAPKLRFARKLLQKKLGFRALVDVIPLDATLIKGSHGRPASRPEDGPLIAAADAALIPDRDLALTDVRDLALTAMGLGE